MKRIISSTLLLAITFTMLASAASVKGFSDVKQTEWSYNYIMLCAQHGAVNGTTEPDANGIATFAPKMEVSLGQFLAAMTKLLCPSLVMPLEEGQSWTLPYYNAAVEAKLISQADFAYSMINEKLSREDMAYILVNAAKYNGETLSAKENIANAIADYNTVSTNRKDAVEKAYSNGLITGTDANGTFAPQDSMTREQMATVICRLMQWTERAEVSAHIHKYEEKIISPSFESGGYTLHTCSICGASYKDSYTNKFTSVSPVQKEIMDSFGNPIGLDKGWVEVPTGVSHTMKEHTFTSTVNEPKCMAVGYTSHVCTACGYIAFTDLKYPIGYHSYRATEVIAPSPSKAGYTIYTCLVCGDSYNGDYTNPVFKSDGWKGDDYGSNEDVIGDATIAGQFVDNKDFTREFYKSGMSAEDARQALNRYIYNVYSRKFFAGGIKKNNADDGKFARFVTHSDGRLGINVFQWRKSYDSSTSTNTSLNAVMESFYFFTKDKDVAYALWRWIDAKNINGRANSDDFGFRDVTWSNGGGVITMNGINIEVDNSTPGQTIYYFN